MGIKRFETDVAIVGAGGAGMAAGIEALHAGARAIAFEMAGEPGGASITSGGGCLIVDSPLQRARGIEDSPDLAFDDWMRWGGPSVDAVWARYYIEHSLNDLYLWAERLGVEWADMKPQEGNSVVRWTQPGGAGQELTSRLIEAYRARGGEIVPDTEITSIRIEGGRAAGLEGRDVETGDEVEIACRAVLVATGGFNSNLDMILDVRPDLARHRIMEGSGRNANGSGHALVREAGGYLTHLGNIWLYVYATPDYRDPRGRRGLVFRGTPGYIWVNQQGRRFHNEALSGAATATPALLAQDPCHAWAILDAGMTGTMEVADPHYREGSKVSHARIAELFAESPFIANADTLDGLAEKIRVDEAAFLDTIARYNRALDDGLEAEPEFGKPLGASKKFDTPPFSAVQLFPLARKNFGGVKTDLRCRVLDKHFEPIPGLYAAGELAGMAGGHINGEAGLEGTMLGPAIFSGRVAGGWAAEEAGYGEGFRGNPDRR